MENEAENPALARAASPLSSNGFQSRCLSRPSENEYSDRSKLVSPHPPALANVKLGLGQIFKNVDECAERVKDLGEYVGLLKGDLGGLKTAAEDEIKSIEAITPPVKSKVITELRGFITEQQEEYFKLHKELCILTKEKGEIEKQIQEHLEKIKQLEDSLSGAQQNNPL